MKVKGRGATFGLVLGGPMGRGWGAEGADRLRWGRSGVGGSPGRRDRRRYLRRGGRRRGVVDVGEAR
jgi:hypothetical protein